MSLFSILNNDTSSTSSTSTSTQIAQALQALAAKNAAKAGSTTNGTNQTGVSITVEAKRAANAKADAGKDAAALAAELRKAFDTAGKNSADLTTLSGRALATVALNEGGQFSPTEIAAAKLELRTRDRQSALTMLSSGPLTSATLTTYTTNLLAARESMSAEEQKLRGSDPDLR
jgi:predicted flap endonuclease-1-like 5' DNA nuclease